MSTYPASSCETQTEDVRWAAYIGLLLGEIILLAVSFDADVLVDVAWAAWLFPYVRLLVHPGLMILGLTVVLGGRALLQQVRTAVKRSRSWQDQGGYLLAHVASYLALWALSYLLLGGDFASQPYPLAVFAGWVIACLLTFGFWLAVILSPADWPRLTQENWRALLYAAAVGTVAWGLGRSTQYLWQPLSQGTMWIVVSLLQLVTPTVIYEPQEFLIGTPGFHLLIWEPCSGYEGIGLIWAFLTAYLWTFRDLWRFPQALLLFPVGTALIWIANAVRITVLILIGEYYSPQVALGGFHSQAGAFAFAAIGLGLVIGAQRLPWLSTRGSGIRVALVPSAPYVMPLIALLVTMMVTRAVTDGPDILYPLRVFVVGGVIWYYRQSYYSDRVFSGSAFPSAATAVPPPAIRPVDRSQVTGAWMNAATPVFIGTLVFVLWIALESLGSEALVESTSANPNSLSSWFAGSWLAFRIAGSVMTVPIAEELAFRGYLLRRLESAEFSQVAFSQVGWLAILISSAAFGVLHGRWLAGTLAGGLYALAARRRGRLFDSIFAHALTNLLIAAYVLATGKWSLWA